MASSSSSVSSEKCVTAQVPLSCSFSLLWFACVSLSLHFAVFLSLGFFFVLFWVCLFSRCLQEMPKAPKAHADSTSTKTVDLRDRRPRTLCDGMVQITFPVSLEESHAQFELLRSRAGEWKPFVARGIRDKETKEVRPMDMGSMKLPFLVKPRGAT